MKLNSMRLIFGGISLFALCGFAVSCSEKAEQAADTVQAAQIETEALNMAAAEGRDAAKVIINRNWPDTLELQKAILDARAANSKYEIEGNEACKAAFDTAFINTIRTVRPELADILQSSK